MGSIIHHSHCAVCNSPRIKEALEVKDYTVSGEQYKIMHCDDCTFRFTQDVPNADNIGKYYKSSEYVSHTNSKKGIINRLYHLVRNATLKQKLKLVQQVTGRVTGAILDVGAGTGFFAAVMKQNGWGVTALEPDDEARAVAAKEKHIELLPLEQLFHLPENSFDCITLWHVLEHVHELQKYLSHFAKLLKPGGRLIVAVPNYTSYDSKTYNQHWAAYDVPRHLWHFSPKSMQLLMEKNHFKLMLQKPMWFDSFYVSMLSEKCRNGSLIGAVINGAVSNIKAFGNVNRCSSIIYCMSKV